MPAVKKPAPKRATLTKIRKASEIPTEEVYVAEYDGTVLVQGLTGEGQIQVGEAEGDFQVNLLVACIVEPAMDYEQALALYRGPVGPFNEIVMAINRCNGEGASEEALRTFPAGSPE